jgi:hypothetical protein
MVFCFQVKESKEQLEKATLDLAEVSKQIADAHGDSAETERAKYANYCCLVF